MREVPEVQEIFQDERRTFRTGMFVLIDARADKGWRSSRVGEHGLEVAQTSPVHPIILIANLHRPIAHRVSPTAPRGQIFNMEGGPGGGQVYINWI